MRTQSFFVVYDSLTKIPDISLIYGEFYNPVFQVANKNMTEKTLTGIYFYMSIAPKNTTGELIEIEGDKTGSRVGFELDTTLLTVGGEYDYQIRANNGDNAYFAYGRLKVLNRIE